MSARGWGVPVGVCVSTGCVSAGGVCLAGGGRGTCPGTPPLCTEFFTHAYENITLPQTSFAAVIKINLVVAPSTATGQRLYSSTPDDGFRFNPPSSASLSMCRYQSLGFTHLWVKEQGVHVTLDLANREHVTWEVASDDHWSIITARQQKLPESNVFTGVCHSVGGGRVVPLQGRTPENVPPSSDADFWWLL